MKIPRNRKQAQQRRRNLLLLGAGVGSLGLVAGGLVLTRRPQQAQPRTTTPSVRSAPVRSVQRIGISSIQPRTASVKGGAIVHVPGKRQEYYPSSPLVERTVRLGKPGGRPRSRKNWNDWDYYRDTNKGAYNLRKTRRYDKGRL